jgi:hypothetical protein
MLSFVLNLVLGIAGLVCLIFFIRYSLTMLSGFDKFFTKRYRRTSRGLRWGIRLPTKAGELTEFYFYVILGKKNYMNYSSWPVKITLVISMFLYLALLTSRGFVVDYYTFQLGGGYFEGGSILWYLHLVTLAYLTVVALVTFDSWKMMGFFASLRILYFVVLMIAATIASALTFSLFLVFSFFYLVIKIIMAFFVSRRRRHSTESKPPFMAKHYARFLEVHDTFDHPDIVNEGSYDEPPVTKRYYDDDIKKVYSD